LLAVTATALAAPPQVEIRAQTRVIIDSVRLVGDDLAEIRGELLDALTGDGIDRQQVAIRIGTAAANATTDTEGKFRARMSVEPGPQPVDLEFAGNKLLGSSQLSQITDPARAQVSLAFDFEEARGGVNVRVRATADDQPVRLPIALSAGAPADDKLIALGDVRSGAPFLLTRQAAGGPGVRKVRAVFAGDDTRQAATAEKTVELSAASTTTMAASATRLAYEDDLEITGKVTDEDNHSLGRAAVTLASGDRRLAQGATAEDGSYKFKIEGEILGQGQWGIQVQADPGRPSIKPSRSAPAVIQVAAPQPVPVSYTIAAFLATACAAGGFFTARARPWRRLRRSAQPGDAPAQTPRAEQIEGGLVAAKPGLVSTLRRPSDDGFAGAVRDTVRGRPIADAVVRLQFQHGRDPGRPIPRAALPPAPPGDPAGSPAASSLRSTGPAPGGADPSDAPRGRPLSIAPREAHSGPDGNFAFEALAAGEWIAEVCAPGHVTEKFVISIPHRGELRGVRIDLVPVRERVFQLYRRAAEPVLPEPRLWGIWSPRQIVDHVRSRRPTPALAELTSFVEEIYFSPRLAGEAVLPEAAEQVERAIHERARAAS
jgi:hypothetical protein